MIEGTFYNRAARRIPIPANPGELTQTLLSSLRSRVCPACGQRKAVANTLCRNCYHLLTKSQQVALYRLAGQGYEPAVLEALGQLNIDTIAMAAPAAGKD